MHNAWAVHFLSVRPFLASNCGKLLGHKGLVAHIGKPGCRKLRHHHVIHAIGTLANQQLPGLVPAHDQPYMGGVRAERKISWHGFRLGYRCHVIHTVPKQKGYQRQGILSPAADILLPYRACRPSVHFVSLWGETLATQGFSDLSLLCHKVTAMRLPPLRAEIGRASCRERV